MTDLEDEDDLTEGQMSVLEEMVQAHAAEHYSRALQSDGGPRAYFRLLIHDVVKDYKNAHAITDNVYNFAIERWRYWARHAELLDHKRIIAETYIDTFHYLTRIKNDFPMLDKPPYRDDPFH